MSEYSADKRVDYSGRMGPKFPLHTESKPPEWSMYSYERPAWLYWNGVANYLRSLGMSDEQIREKLESKHVRWMLDSRDAAIEQLGHEHAKSYFLAEKS